MTGAKIHLIVGLAAASLLSCERAPRRPSIDAGIRFAAERDASIRTRVDGSATRNDPSDAGTSACVITLEEPSHLRGAAVFDSVGPMLPRGTEVVLLGAAGGQRNGGMLAQVEVRNSGVTGFLFVHAESLLACQQARRRADPLLRDERMVMVDGVEETWQLRWKRLPARLCDEDDRDDTCDCWPFEVGESGPIELIRQRGGRIIDRFDRWAHYSDIGNSSEGLHWSDELGLRRWIVPSGLHVSDADLATRVQTSILLLEDIDHDGRATEFVVDGAGSRRACGHWGAFVVGISSDEPTLHVFRRTEDHNEVAWLRGATWHEVALSNPAVAVWQACGDHAGAGETLVVEVTSVTGRFGFRFGYYPTDDSCHRNGPITWESGHANANGPY